MEAKEKTALWQAIELVERAVAYNVEGSHKVKPYTWTELSNDLDKLLATEKQQMIDFYTQSAIKHLCLTTENQTLNALKAGEQYYQEQFKQ